MTRAPQRVDVRVALLVSVLAAFLAASALAAERAWEPAPSPAPPDARARTLEVAAEGTMAVEPVHGEAPPVCLQGWRAPVDLAQAARAEASDDPWLPAGAEALGADAAEALPPPEAPVAAPVEPLRVQRVHFRPDGSMEPWGGGALDLGQEWTPPTLDDGRVLRCYDLFWLRRADDAHVEALRGRPVGALEPSDNVWWRALAQEVHDAVGAGRWPEESTLLAWDWPYEERLLVRQDERGQARVAAVLEEKAQRQSGSIPVEVVRLDPRGPAFGENLVLDVPWSSVRAHRGTSAAYLADVDIEVGNDWSLEPLLGACDGGFAVSARRIAGDDAEGEIDLSLGWSGQRPWFDLTWVETWTFGGPLVPIEIPCHAASSWRGRLPAYPGTHRFTLDDGTECLVRVGKEVVPPAPPAPIAVTESPPSPSPGARGAAVLLRVRLEGETRRRPLAGETYVCAGGRVGTIALGAQGEEPAARLGAESCAEGTQVELVALPLRDGSLVVDFVLTLQRDLHTSRTVVAKTRPYGIGELRDTCVDLPQCRSAVISRRLVVPPSGRASLPLEADLGAGPQRLTLVLEAEFTDR